MATYILRRILLMIPTLFGITLLSFVIINLAPGSPVDQKLQQLRMGGSMGGGSGSGGGMGGGRGDSGVSQAVIDALNNSMVSISPFTNAILFGSRTYPSLTSATASNTKNRSQVSF